MKSSMESVPETPSAAHANTDVYADNVCVQTGGVHSCENKKPWVYNFRYDAHVYFRNYYFIIVHIKIVDGNIKIVMVRVSSSREAAVCCMALG